MQMNELITVIIPAYNVFSYIEKCLQSVLRQSYSNLEIILVDDGSNDGTEKVCDKYAQIDSRVNVIHKENSGQADSRNIAIEKARGKYLAFIDADDFVTEDYIEFLYNLLTKNNADISNCCFKRVWDNKNTKENNKGNSFTKIFNAESAIENLCYMKELIPGPYCKLFKREIWKDIRFPVGCIYEDLAVMYKLFNQASIIVFESAEKYFYYQRAGSLLHSDFNTSMLSRIEFADEIEEFVSQNYPNILKSAMSRKFWSNAGALMNLPWSNEYRNYYQIIKQNIRDCRKTVLFDSKAKLNVRIMAASSYLGIVPLKILGSLYNAMIK